MEYVDGTSITAFCDQNNLRLKDRIRLFLKVCTAISYAHAKLIIHSDLNPSNILVVGGHTSGSERTDISKLQIKLLDFGIATLLQDEREPEESIDAQLLTPEYAAPEQLLRQSVTAATDVYALGLLLYQLLTETLAQNVKGKPAGEVKSIISEAIPMTPSSVVNGTNAGLKRRRRQLLGDLDAIILKALQKSPDERYSSVEAMAEDLRRYLGLLPVTARDSSWWYRLGKFVHRYRWAVSATLLVLALLTNTTYRTIQSNQQIRSALATANLETAKATEIASFLSELFEVADPFVRNGEEVTVIELLEKGSERITTDLAKQPETQSQLMFELARIHNSLGLFSRSNDLLEQTKAIQQSTFGDAHIDIARSLHWQSIVADNLGAYEQSEIFAEAALAMRLELLGADHPDVGESMDRLGSLLAYRGQKDRALDLAREAVRILNSAVGEDDQRTQTARHNLAWMLGRVGRYEEATPVYEQVIEVATRVAGADHPETLETLNNFGVMLRHKGDIERAEAIYRGVLANRLRLLGPDHPQVGFSQNNLAKLLQDKGELEEAIDLYQKSLEILKISYGPEHGNVAISLSNLAGVLSSQGQLPEAEANYREALAIHRKNSPQGSIKIASTLLGLGHLLMETGEIQQAEPMLREALAIQRENLEADHWEIAETQLHLGRLLILKGEREKAAVMLQQSNSVLAEQFGGEHKLVKQSSEALSLLNNQ